MFVVVYAATRFMGKRQLGQLELSELIVALLIADLAAQPLSDIGVPLINGLIPVMFLLCGEILISGAALKSKRFHDFLWGKPNMLVESGKINLRELRRSRISLDELAEALRKKNIFDLADVKYAVFETDGTISAIMEHPRPKADRIALQDNKNS
jgi:uncharacterized membrane protein YcaP (DUF421 family)